MRIRRAAAQAIADQLSQRVRFAQAMTVVTAIPSLKTSYPAGAILIDSAVLDASMDDDVEINPNLNPGDDGYLLAGGYRTDDQNNYAQGSTWQSDSGTTLSHVGTIQMTGRLWVASRSDPQREQLEQDVALAFYEDRLAPGRMQVSVTGINVSGTVIPFGIATCTVDSKIQWSNEFAFAERLWTYLTFELDAPLLIPRNDPLASTLLLYVSEDLATTVSTEADLLKIQSDQYSIDSLGNPTGT